VARREGGGREGVESGREEGRGRREGREEGRGGEKRREGGGEGVERRGVERRELKHEQCY
jgi:hypothetical protein